MKPEPAEAFSAGPPGGYSSSSPVLRERYEILSLLGRGGMGAVYQARDRTSGEVVAVKVLLESRASAVERFAREIAVLSGLDHPGIVRYGAHGVTETGEPYLAMEWLDGENLSDRLRRDVLTVDEALTLATKVAEALAAAHARGVVHRDLKPSNLFLVQGAVEQVKVLDFGIAYLEGATAMTKTGALIGTPGYMAPEQARTGSSPTPAADIFALGCVLFEALVGRPAFEGQSAMAVLAKLIFDEAPLLEAHRSDTPPALVALVGRMLAKDPVARPEDGGALLAALAALPAPGGAQTAATVSMRWAPVLTEAEQRVVSIVMIRPEDGGGPAFRGESLLAEVRRAAEDAAGRVEPLADGSIAVAFDGSGVVKDQVTLAARFALAVQARLPAAFIALATGRYMPRSASLLGAAIERAAQAIERPRGAAAAGPSPVAIDDTTAALLEARFEWREGAVGPELLGEHEAAEPARMLLGKPVPCVGRERELKALESAFEFCVEEHSAQVFLVTAPAGVGKSRLAHELAQAIQRRAPDAAIWFGRGDSMRADSSLHLMGQVLAGALGLRSSAPVEARREALRARVQGSGEDARRLAEFLGEIVGTPFPAPGSAELAAARRDPLLMADQTQRALGDFLQSESAARPLVIILDDLHWGDAASVRFLDVALRDAEGRGVFVLGLARPEVHERFPRLWAERGMQELHLSLLSPRASRRLVGAALGEGLAGEVVDRLVALSEGNAFYLEELIRAAAAGAERAVPETVVAMVQARLEGLDPDARRVLRAASLYGEVFWSGGVAALLGDLRGKQAADWLARLCQQEVLVRRAESRLPGEEELAFRHALLREGAYAMLTEQDRALGHRLAGQWLEEHGEPDALTLAEHFERGDDRARAAEHYLRAAERAAVADDVDAILACADRGLGCEPAGELRAALLSLEAGVLLGREWYAESIALATEAIDGLPEDRRWYMTFIALCTAITISRPGALIDLAQRFRDVVPNPEVRNEYFRAGTRLYSALSMLGERAVARELLVQMTREDVHPAEGDASIWGYLKGAATSHHHFIEEAPWSYKETVKEIVHGMAQARRWADRRILATFYGKALLDLGDHAGAAAVLRENLADRKRDAFSLAFARVYLARLLARIAPPEELAEPEDLARAVIAADNPMMIGLAHGVLAQLAVRRGDLATAETEARVACERVRPYPTYSWDITALRVQILLSLGRAREALDAGEEALARLARLEVSGYGEIDLRLAVAEALVAAGRAEEGRAMLRETLPGLRRRVDDIPEGEARARYLTEVPTHARLLALATAWLGEAVLREAGLIAEVAQRV